MQNGKQFLRLYYDLREKEDNRPLNKLTLKQRQILHGMILNIYRIKNRLGGFSYEVIGDRREQTMLPRIFAVTHVGKFDIEVVSEAIREHFYLLSGDFEHIQGIVDALFLAMNGVIYINERVKEGRRAASKKDRTFKEFGFLIKYAEYMELFESVWKDRAKNAGWKIDFVYKDEYTSLIFNRGLTDEPVAHD